MKRRIALYGALAFLFIVACTLSTRHTLVQIHDLLHWQDEVHAPFGREAGTVRVRQVGAEAQAAGLQVGDRVTTIAGRAYTGRAALTAALRGAKPGDPLVLGVRRASASGPEESLQVTIVLAPASRAAPTLRTWVFNLIMVAAMPAFCLLLGFWVVAVRPTDPLAWLLLSVMLSFSQFASGAPYDWASPLRDVGVLYHSLIDSSWPISMMLFGIYFPERLVFDRQRPLGKWIVLLPIAAIAIARAIVDVGASEHLEAVLPLEGWLASWQTPILILQMVAISFFFMFLGMKVGMATSRDTRRRLHLLSFGTTVSMAPSFVVALVSLVRKTPFESSAPAWFVFPSILMIFLFPLTLAYVIVVHQALDVRVVLRQGLQYAFARRGIRVAQAVMILAILGTMSVIVRRPDLRRVDAVGIVGISLVMVVGLGRVAERLGRWTDRKFFRDGYSAEQILSDLSEKVRTMVEIEPLVSTVASRISESLHVPKLVIFLEDKARYRPVYAIGYETLPAVTFLRGGATHKRLSEAGEPVRVYRNEPSSWVNRPEGPDREERASLEAIDSQLLLPLSVKEKMPGFVSLGPKLSEEPYSGIDVRLLKSVALQTALALENSRLALDVAAAVAQRERLTREVEIAREVQERLFPQTLPPIPGLDYAGHCRPALGVGGDYFDFLSLSGGRLGIAIGDVSGKGIAAALLMASLQASLRGQTMQGEGDLARLVGNVSRLVYDASPDNRYATFFYAQFDPATRRLAYVNAGHCAPIVLRGDGSRREVLRLKEGGTVVGLFDACRFTEGSIALAPGDLIVAYTDGISEALNPAEEEWGEDRLIAAAADCEALGARDTIARLLADADRFVAGADQHDDMTLIVLRLT